MTGRQSAAITHLQMVGRDIHQYVALARQHGVDEAAIKQAIADGVALAEAEGGDVRALVQSG